MVCMYRGLVTMTKKAFPSSSSSSVQELYDLCIMTFTPSGTSPASPQAIQKLCSLLDTIRPADIGLKEEDQGDDRGHGLFGLPRLNRVGRWAQPITYVDVHECDSFTMCIFCFPTSSVIPLHNHPGMTVLSKVLYGSLHVKAYDWVEPEKMQRCMGPNDSPATGKGDELNDGNEEDYAWLAQIGTPDDLYMRSGEYQGPVIKV
ncbi:hypothetical protein RHMOL_Rhmol08G0187600 [Rhododendron molle]|uniref:Uncharacterized protein n=1 Tax=Rhododendron molle TaxID=49168 RepID=A0ACC0MQY3_RHOML|nr:hypothetical protein RHMOL_Rhmol08G0187600 [Rhododendron molle]